MTLKCNKSKPNIFKNGEICENLSFGEVMQINNIVVICRDFCGIPVIETLLRRKCHWWHQIENQKLNRHLVKYEVILGFPSNICFSRKLFGLRQSSSHVKSNCVCSSWAILRICFSIFSIEVHPLFTRDIMKHTYVNGTLFTFDVSFADRLKSCKFSHLLNGCKVLLKNRRI